MEQIAGIDLGTSTSCLAMVIDGKPVVIPDSRGNRVTPSYIHVMEDGRIMVGPQAKVEVISDPYSTIWATKRLIGRRYSDQEVQEAKKLFGYEITEAKDGGVLVSGRDKELSPTEVGAIILKYLLRVGKKHLGQEIKRAIITVPAYFTDPQRKATREAGTMVGLDVVRLVNEPTAAALAYGYDRDVEQTVAVYDLGGGTFDLSIMSIGQGVFEVMATDGDSYLGGEDFDNILVHHLVEEFKKKHNINIFNDKMAHQRVKDAAERAKIELSKSDEAEINIPSICPDLDKFAVVEAVINRKQFEHMTGHLIDKTIDVFKKLLKDASMSIKDLDNVIMVGGMTRMPLVLVKVEEFLGREPDTSVDADEAVGIGAAIHAASLSGQKMLKKRRVVEATAAKDTRPEQAAAQEKTRPGAVSSQERTMPGQPAQEAVSEPKEKEAPSVKDLEQEHLPMDKQDASLPIEPERVEQQQPAPQEGPRPQQASEPERAGLQDFFADAEEQSGLSASPGDTMPGALAEQVMEEQKAGPEEFEPEMPEAEEPVPLSGEEEATPADEAAREQAAQAMAGDHPVLADPDTIETAEDRTRSMEQEGLEEEKAEEEEEGQEEMVAAPVLLDVLTHTLGIAHFGGHFVPLINRFAKLPARATKTFTTCVDQQENLRITVLQGEEEYVQNNTSLGEFVLSGIEKAKRGVPEVEVCFDIDQSGLFKVSAKDKRSGAEKEIKIENWVREGEQEKGDAGKTA